MTAQDFRELPTDGAQFETLVAALLESIGYRIIKAPGQGTDGGSDIIIERVLHDPLGLRRELVVVQCKHYAGSGKSVGPKDVGNWHNAMIIEKASGYLLVTDTRVTSTMRTSFRSFTENPEYPHSWAHAWDVDELCKQLNLHPKVRDTWFTHLKPDSLNTPRDILELKQELVMAAENADALFDQQKWGEFASAVTNTRLRLGSIASDPRHFELYFHLKRLTRFQDLAKTLSGQQLAFERLIESFAVEHLLTIQRKLTSVSDIESALLGLDYFHQQNFDLAAQETRRLTVHTEACRNLVMVGCGAFPHTLICAALTNDDLICTGLDYDNSSLVLAHKVRQHLGLTSRIHYVTQNGDVFDYHDHDLIIIANIVSPKAAVLKRVVYTSRKGAIVVVRNPVTFGEVLWDDAHYGRINDLELVDRFDSDAFGECFETAVLRKV